MNRFTLTAAVVVCTAIAAAACSPLPGDGGLLIERSDSDYNDNGYGPDGKGGFVDNDTGGAVDSSGNPI